MLRVLLSQGSGGGGCPGKPTHPELSYPHRWRGRGLLDPTDPPPTHRQPLVQRTNRMFSKQRQSSTLPRALFRAINRNCSTNLVLMRNRWGENKQVTSYNELTERRNTVPWTGIWPTHGMGGGLPDPHPPRIPNPPPPRVGHTLSKTLAVPCGWCVLWICTPPPLTQTCVHT